MNERNYDLEDRLIDFAVRIIKMAEELPSTKIGNHICTQILKSGTSPAPNYGEAQGAESRSDFIHKLKIALKELKETKVWVKIIIRAELIKPTGKLEPLLQENEELISIIFTSIETARNNYK
jgi:four helix bundle protein